MPIDKKKVNCYQYCLKRLNRRSYTSYELKRILHEKEFNEEEIEAAIKRCSEFNFINDQNYSSSFIYEKQSIKRWGKLKIINELNKRGIEAVSDDSFDSEIERLNIKRHLSYKLSIISKKEQSEIMIKQQIYRYLYFKGFEPELIQQALKEASLG